MKREFNFWLLLNIMLKLFLLVFIEICVGEYVLSESVMDAKNTKLEAEILEIKGIIENETPLQTEGEW